MKDTVVTIFESSWPTLVIFLSIVIILRITYLKHNNKKIIFYKEIFFLVFLAYLLLLYQLVTFKEIDYSSSNLIPFKEIFRYKIGSTGFYNQVIGNVLLLIPYGFFVTDYVKVTKLRTIFFITFLTSLVIETTQYFIGRCFDIDDIILNVLGGIIGFLIYVGLSEIKNHLPKLFQKDSFYSFICFILILFVVLYFLGIFDKWSFFNV